jgi:hypothetical protein
MNATPFSDEEIFIRQQLESLKQIVDDQIVYTGPPDAEERGNVLCFDLNNRYCGMGWRSEHQRQSRISLAKGHYAGLDERGDPDQRMEELLKVRTSTIKKRLYRAKDSDLKSPLTLALKLQLGIDKRSEKLLAGIDHLCIVLHRPPAQFELQAHLKISWSTLSEGLFDIGFEWLPKRKSGPKKASISV